jgi:DNA-binding transcriptional MerR regulator
VIGELRGLGLTIAEIRDLAAVCLGHPGESVGPHLAALLRRARDRADARIRTLQELWDRIDLALADDDLAGDAGRPRRVSQEIERPTRTGAKHRRLASGRVVSGPVRGPGNWTDSQGRPQAVGAATPHPTGSGSLNRLNVPGGPTGRRATSG